MRRFLIGALLASASFSGAAYAQSGVDGAVASCSVAGAGTGGLTAFLNEARIAGTFSEDLLTQLAVGLGQAGGAGVSAPVRLSISNCLGVVAAASLDPARQAAIREIAQTVVQGGGVDTAAIGGVGASAI